MIDSPDLDSLQSELPSLRCLRLNSDMNEDGVINHDESDLDDNLVDEEDIGNDNEESIFPYQSFESEASSDEDIDDFEDAHHDHDELESLDDVMHDE